MCYGLFSHDEESPLNIRVRKLRPDNVKRLFRVASLINYLKRVMSRKDAKMFNSIKIYLVAFVGISIIFNVFSINYMSKQAVLISNHNLETDAAKEFINCVRSEVLTYSNFTIYKDVSEETLAKRIRRCIYRYELDNNKRLDHK